MKRISWGRSPLHARSQPGSPDSGSAESGSPDIHEPARNRNCAIAATLVVLGFFVAFAGDGLSAYFTPDDMMNLYGAWFRPIVENDRLLGAVYYRAMFAAFGLDPIPYRVGCMVLVLVNLGLLYAFCYRLTHSREIAALACLLGAYHAHLADLYYSTGTVFDLLCGALYMAAFLYHARIRQRAESRWPHIALFLLLYVFALNAKEMAVTLPAIILFYDLLYHPPGRAWRALLDWTKREARVLGPAALVTAVFLVGKFAGPASMLDNPGYRPHFAWSVFMAAWKHYGSDLFYGILTLTQVRVILLWALMIGIAVIFRRRALAFAFLFLFAGILPVAFIPLRGFFAIYLTLPGWYLFAADALVAARDSITSRFDSVRVGPARTMTQAALFLIVASVLLPLHRREKPLGKQWVAEAHAAVRTVAQHLGEVAGPLPHGARVLFLSDTYPKDDWILTFIFRLYYRDDMIRVDRVQAMRTHPDARAQAQYDRLFATDGSTLSMLPRP